MSCCDSRATLDLGCITKNDTWPGFSVSISSASTLFTGTLTGVRMRFKDADGTSVLLITNGDGITITTATANDWTFSVDSRVITFDAGEYTHGIELTDSNSTIWTPIVGTLTVEEDPV